MRKLLAFAMLLCLSSCDTLNPKPKEYEVNFSSKYEGYNSLGNYRWYDHGATLFVFKDVDSYKDGYLFDGKQTLFSTTKKLKYDKVITLDKGFITLKLNKGTYTFVCVSAHKTYNGNDHSINGSMAHKMASYDIKDNTQEVNFVF